MRRFAKYILIAAGILLLVYVLAALGLNIYLQSEGLQERIRAAAESAAGSPVRIHGTHYAPWSGFTISGVSVSGQGPAGHPPMLEAGSVSFRFDFLSLLRGRLVVSEVGITNPVLLARHPEPIPEPEKPAPGPTPPPGGVEISVVEPPAPRGRTAPPVEVKRVRITNGTAQFFDSKGALAVTLTGVEVTGNISPDRSVAGDFRVAETSVGAFVHPGRVKGTFIWKDGGLDIPDLQAEWAGGKLTGTLAIDPEKGFAIEATAEGILIKKLAEEAGINGEGSRGSLFSKGTLQGVGGKPETFTGRVDVSLQQARFQPLDFIRKIGELMNIQELQMLELKTAEAVFLVHNRKVVTDTIVLESENLVIDAKGPTSFDGKMKLQARLHLNERLRKDLAGLLGNNFKESERPGYQQMPFSITGTVSRPKTDILDKLTGFRIGEDLGGILKNLFKAPPEKKPEDPPAGKEPGGG